MQCSSVGDFGSVSLAISLQATMHPLWCNTAHHTPHTPHTSHTHRHRAGPLCLSAQPRHSRAGTCIPRVPWGGGRQSHQEGRQEGLQSERRGETTINCTIIVHSVHYNYSQAQCYLRD